MKKMKAAKPIGTPSEEELLLFATTIYSGDGEIWDTYKIMRKEMDDIGPPFPLEDELDYLRKTSLWAAVPVASLIPPRLRSLQRKKQPLTTPRVPARQDLLRELLGKRLWSR